MAIVKKKNNFDLGSSILDPTVFEILIKDITESKKYTDELKKTIEDSVFNAINPTFINSEGVEKLTYEDYTYEDYIKSQDFKITPLINTDLTVTTPINSNVTLYNAPTLDNATILQLQQQIQSLMAQQTTEEKKLIKKEPQKVQCEDILDSKRSIKLSDE